MKAIKPVELSDGRLLAYAEFGSPAGRPIFMFNGSTSRLFYPMDDAIAVSAGVRIITVDRPGIGMSTFKPDRTLLQWPDDLQELADALGLDQFVVAGGSAGGPYAAVCAYKLPDRVTALGLFSSLAPFDIPGILRGMLPAYRTIPALVRYAPWFLTFAQSVMSRNPNGAWRQFYKRLPACDKAILKAHPEVAMQAALVQDIAEAHRAGAQGVISDMAILTRPWGFSPAQIQVKTYLWHGEQDLNVPLTMGQFLAKAIPDCDARFVPNQGHLVYISHWQEIVRTLSGTTS